MAEISAQRTRGVRWWDPATWIARLARRFLGHWRVRTPTMLQMQQAECGAACLGIVLGYYGYFERLEKLRYACGVSRDGAKASNVLRAAREFGLVAKGFARNALEARHLPLPFVAMWNFTHFVVVEGFGRDKVYLNDPASGPRVVSEHEFKETFSGVLLAFQPGDTFVRTRRPPGILASLLERTRGSWWGYAFVVLVSLTLFLPGLMVPSFSRVFVDFFLIQDQTRWLRWILVLMTATALVGGVLNFLMEGGLVRFYTKLSTNWSSQMVWHVLRLPIDYFSQRAGGDLADRIQSNPWLAWLVAGELSSTFLGLTTLLVYVLVMVQYEATLTFLVVFFALVNLVAFFLVSRRLSDVNQKFWQEKGNTTGLLMQGLRSIDTYQASGTESLFFNRWAAQYTKVINSFQRMGRTRAMLTALPPLLNLLSITAILVVGGRKIMSGEMTIGMLVAFLGLVAAFSLPVQRLIGAGAAILEAQGLVNRLDDVMRQETDEEFDRGGTASSVGLRPLLDVTEGGREMPRKLGGSLQLEGVTFGFSPLDDPLIVDFDLRLEPGVRVALVGPSGSGKSTIGRMIAGILTPWQGEIRVDGWRIDQVPRDVFRNTVAVVDQEIALFEGTVAENITMWDRTLPEARMVEAAKDACLHEQIASRPNGYRQLIQEGGRNFSGGERQRIEIARALVNEPSLLILDEATSALDASTESRIIENLRRRGCTAIIIAHRLSTIRDCDEIIVLERGRVAERGTHLRLVEADGLYRRLIES